jgi:tellurite resistance protein
MSGESITLAQLFLNISQVADIERLKSRTQRGGRLPRDVAEAADRVPGEPPPGREGEVAEIADRVRGYEPGENPVLDYLKLHGLEQRLAAIGETAERAGGEGEVRGLIHEAQKASEAALRRCDEGERPAVKRCGQLLNEAVLCLNSLLEQAQEPARERGAVMTLGARVRRLEALLKRLRKTWEEIPNVSIKQIPRWEVLSEAENTIISAHNRNVFLFKCAVFMARADGELSSVERNFLHAIAERIKLSRLEANSLIRQGSDVRPGEFSGSDQEAVDLLHKLYLCALADGVVAQSERRTLMRIANSLDIPGERVEKILSGRGPGEEMSFLDAEAVLESLRSRRRMPDDVFLPENVSLDLREQLMERLQFPSEEQLILVYSSHFLGEIFECGVLTDRFLYLGPHGHPRHKVPLDDIEIVRPAIDTSVVQLASGKRIRMARGAERFLTFVMDCVRENLQNL